MNFTILEETIYQSSDVNELEERISQSGIWCKILNKEMGGRLATTSASDWGEFDFLTPTYNKHHDLICSFCPE
jgi:hypothetical protein